MHFLFYRIDFLDENRFPVGGSRTAITQTYGRLRLLVFFEF